MDHVDLNLLVALDVLLAEGSVTTAARKLGLSTSAMSRTLTRLRATTGDPLLVRAGRGLVPTTHATALRDHVHELSRDVRAVLRPHPGPPEIASFDRTFTVRANESFVSLFSVPLLAEIRQAAPRVRLRFAPKPDKDSRPLREGLIDLEIGLVEASAPEMRTQLLFRDERVGIARIGHPLLGTRARSAKVTPERYAACQHVIASARGDFTETVDDALGRLGLQRDVVVVVPEFPDAMRIVRQSDLVAVVPRSCLGNALVPDHAAMLGLRSFELPVPTPAFVISAVWHPRVDADPAHRWLRGLVTTLCKQAYPARSARRRLSPAAPATPAS